MNIEDNLYKYLPHYSDLPPFLKYITGNLYRLIPVSARYGSYYKRTLELLEIEKNLNKQSVQTFQLKKLSEIVKYANIYVEYYRKKYNSKDIEISSFEDFYNLPFLTKRELREHPDELLSKQFSKNDLITISTGGSTGEPLLLYYEKGIVRTREFAYLNNQWAKVGYRFGDKLAVFRSAMIRGRVNSNLWEYDPVKNRWIYSTYDLVPANIKKIIAHLRKVKPKYLYIYPSALTVVANFMQQTNEPPIPSIKGILSASENALPSQVKLFEDVFRAPVCRQYGLGELSAFAGSCEHSLNYHCYNTYSFVELVDENGNRVVEKGKMGEIVGTTFDVYTMPLIRYRTGDFAVYEGDYCEKCGYHGIIFSEIEGRKQEKIVDSCGNVLSLGPFIFGIHDEFWSKISAIQFVQKEKGKLDILAASNFLEKDEITDYVNRLFENRFKNNFQINIIPTTTIVRTSAGKHKYLIQELPIN